MLTLIIASLLISASAFMPTSNVRSTSKLSMEFAGGLAGADGPELVKFDPLKFSEKSPEWLPWFREAELKHGRVCMLATLGAVVPSMGLRLPGDIFQGGNILDAHNTGVSNGPMVMLLFWVAVLEIISIPALRTLSTGDRAAGDYAFDPIKLSKSGGPLLEKYKVAELKNGRLAMMAFSGIITQAALGKPEFPFF